MATTNRLHQDFISFSTDADPGSAGLTLSAPGLTDLLVVADPDFIALTLDPEEVFGAPEIVWVSVHASSATTATIVRAQEGTAARAHDIGTKVIVPITAAGLVHDQLAGLGDDDHPQYLKADGTRGVTGSLDPATDVIDDLGTATKSWRRAYLERIFDPAGVEAINFDDRQLAGEWEVQNDFLPNTDLGSSLGNATQSFDRLYAQDLYDAAGAQVISLANKSLVGGWTAQNIDPIADVTHDLGDAALTWRRLYAQALYDEGGIARMDLSTPLLSGNWIISGNLDPNSDLTEDLGTAAKTWRRLYADEIFDPGGVRVIDLDGQVLHNGVWRVDGSLRLADGSVGTPSLVFVDPDSGFYAPGAGRVGVTTNGTFEWEWKAAGEFVNVLDASLLANNDTPRTVLGTPGGLNIFTRASGQTIIAGRSGSDGGVIDFRKATVQVGTISVDATNTAYNTSSDERLKDNIRPFVNGLDVVRSLPVRQWEWKVNGDHGVGFVAQEIDPLLPDITNKPDEANDVNDEGWWSIEYGRLTPWLVSAIQELADHVFGRR